MKIHECVKPLKTWLLAGIGAGLAGGIAEVVFMAFYGAAAGMSGVKLLSAITNTFFSAAFSFGPLGAVSGLVIHLLLSAVIGVFFGAAMYALHPGAAKASYARVAVTGIAALTGIWAFNFFILLPQINPQFLSYAPLWAAFFSKLMFGFSVGVYGTMLDGLAAQRHFPAQPFVASQTSKVESGAGRVAVLRDV
ncbi:MAG: hypothetical protein HY884_02980 [Deltaproteobacteria bacterium]|nr:hypothetical protein [Deltaproteobacteria bacterium]